MKYERQNPSARFVVPDKITVRQQLDYFSAIYRGESRLADLWSGARVLMDEWQCEILPDKDTDLETLTDPQITNVIVWAGLEVKKHIDRLGEIPKN